MHPEPGPADRVGPARTWAERLTFVYDADGTLLGEARYWFGTLFGAAHCSLCDLTHSRWGRRSDWRACAEDLGVPIDYLHRDDLVDDLAALGSLCEGRLPCVLAHGADRTVVLFGGDELEAFDGDVLRFEAALREALGSLSGTTDERDAGGGSPCP